MLALNVDEGYAFDYLTILEIKKNRSNKARRAWRECYECLKAQLPALLWMQIVTSEQYKTLKMTNKGY